MFSGRSIAPVYINIYLYISKVNSPAKIFFKVGPGPPVRPLLDYSNAGFSAKSCPAACERGPGSHALPNIAPPEACRAQKLAPFGTLPSMGRPPWGLPRCTVTRAEKFGAFLGVTHKFFLVIGPDLGRRSASGRVVCKFWGERWGPFSSGFGVGAWAPQPPRNQPRGNVPAPSGLVGGPRLRPYVLRPYALGPPHRIQAYLFGVRRSLSARPYLCRLTLSGCHAWVCLGISPALMVPRSSAFHSVFSATHGRKANTKGTVTPLWMYKN